MPELLRWDAPGPYEVVFSTRTGGVSEGPYESLNLGLLTADDPRHVAENRRILCSATGTDPSRLALNRQLHGATVNRARAGGREPRGDALWTEEACLPLLVLAADCIPVVLVRTDGEPALAVVHAGRLGILAGLLDAATRAIGGRLTAAIGPGAGPCCYEVGDDVAAEYRARFGGGIVRGRRLDLWGAAETALHEAGVERVHRFDRCTICDPVHFFSHRRDRGVTGRQGVLAVIRAADGQVRRARAADERTQPSS